MVNIGINGVKPGKLGGSYRQNSGESQPFRPRVRRLTPKVLGPALTLHSEGGPNLCAGYYPTSPGIPRTFGVNLRIYF